MLLGFYCGALLRPGRAATSSGVLLGMPWITGAVVALAMPDMDRDFPGEEAQFWLEHLLLVLVLPLYLTCRDGTAEANPEGVLGLLARERGWGVPAMTRGTMMYYTPSTLGLLPLARVFRVNTNYMLCAPAQIRGWGSRYMLYWTMSALPVAVAISLVWFGIARALLWLYDKLPAAAAVAAAPVTSDRKKK